MYCQNCGAKIPNPKAKYCPSCGSPVIYQKKTSPIVDAIILGAIIVLFIFAVIKISELMTDYKIGRVTDSNIKINTKTENLPKRDILPEVRPPSPGPGGFSAELKSPKSRLANEIKQVLKGTVGEVSVNYNKNLGGYEVEVTAYYNPSLSVREYLEKFGKIFALCYGNPKSNVQFVICKVKERDNIKLLMALGGAAASKIPSYTWDMFSANTKALIKWMENHKSKPSDGKLLMCKFYSRL